MLNHRRGDADFEIKTINSEVLHIIERRLPGGGTVAYVNPTEHRYLAAIEQREEGGTPAIVESIRAGLVFALKEAVGAQAIRTREQSFIRRAIARWDRHPNIEILGSHSLDRLSIVSFVVRHASPDGSRRYLHHNYVVALLNDLFGIQSRGGCSCAGPYGHRLLGIDLERSREFEREIGRGCDCDLAAGAMPTSEVTIATASSEARLM